MEAYEHRITGEPTRYDAAADFNRQYELLHQKLEDERNRADRIEGKAATLLAGTIAILGFSFEHIANIWEALALFAFAWPIFQLFLAYKAITWQDAPSAQEIADKFPWYPQTTVASAALAIGQSVVANAPKIDAKARNLNRAFVAILIVTGLLVVSKVVTNVVQGDIINERTVAAGGAAASGSSSGTNTPNSTKPNPACQKGARSGAVRQLSGGL